MAGSITLHLVGERLRRVTPARSRAARDHRVEDDQGLLAARARGHRIRVDAQRHPCARHARGRLARSRSGDAADRSLLDKLDGVTPRKMTIVGIGAAAIGMVMFVEAWGLHRRRVWAEWLTVIVTSSLIPFEIYHLANHPSLGKVLTLVANVAIVIYLLRHRWLFLPGRIGRWWKARRRR